MQTEEQIESLYRNYASHWLRNDLQTESLVLGLFDDKATIVPSGGSMIITGRDQMKDFWFPPDAPPSTVDLFDQEVLKLSVEANSGFLLGKFSMRFSDPTGSYHTEGFHTLLAENLNGEWKVTTMMWSHPPWELVK